MPVFCQRTDKGIHGRVHLALIEQQQSGILLTGCQLRGDAGLLQQRVTVSHEENGFATHHSRISL